MSHDDKHEHEPRWDVIEKLSNKIDEDIDEAFRVNRMSFIEVDIDGDKSVQMEGWIERADLRLVNLNNIYEQIAEY